MALKSLWEFILLTKDSSHYCKNLHQILKKYKRVMCFKHTTLDEFFSTLVLMSKEDKLFILTNHTQEQATAPAPSLKPVTSCCDALTIPVTTSNIIIWFGMGWHPEKTVADEISHVSVNVEITDKHICNLFLLFKMRFLPYKVVLLLGFLTAKLLIMIILMIEIIT